jgi:hypothetical protein
MTICTGAPPVTPFAASLSPMPLSDLALGLECLQTLVTDVRSLTKTVETMCTAIQAIQQQGSQLQSITTQVPPVSTGKVQLASFLHNL